MEWIFLIVLIAVLGYAGVELVKHFYPSWADKNDNWWNKDIRDRLDAIEKKLGFGGDQ